MRFWDAPTRILQLVQTGVFDRIPDLQVVVTETGLRFGAVLKEQADDRFHRFVERGAATVQRLPSDYIADHSRSPTSPTTTASATAMTSAWSGSSGQATTPTSERTGRTRGGRSPGTSPAWTGPSATSFSPGKPLAPEPLVRQGARTAGGRGGRRPALTDGPGLVLFEQLVATSTTVAATTARYPRRPPPWPPPHRAGGRRDRTGRGLAVG